MGLSSQHDASGTTVTLAEVFDFSCLEDFRGTYEDCTPSTARDFTIDFRNTRYIDSSALGMLIDLRKHIGEGHDITIVNCNPQIKKIFSISRFDKKFTIQ